MAKSATIEGVPVLSAPAPSPVNGLVPGVPVRKRRPTVGPAPTLHLWRVVVALYDCEYGPFEVKATDEPDAIRQVYAEHPQFIAYIAHCRPACEKVE